MNRWGGRRCIVGMTDRRNYATESFMQIQIHLPGSCDMAMLQSVAAERGMNVDDFVAESIAENIQAWREYQAAQAVRADANETYSSSADVRQRLGLAD
jgi:hypothetical protein